jgi:hypothetical protein
MKKLLPALLLLGSCGPAAAIDFSVGGFADLRLISPSEQRSWVDGGLGKTRFGDEVSSPGMSGEIDAEATLQILPGLLVTGLARIEATQKTVIDFLEAYARYRPVSTSAFRFSAKAGAFFAPISLENTEVGWSSPWTLTPSAINSWVGEELRTIGGEGTVEWRSEQRTIGIVASAYGWNDPAGILLNTRGWALDDRATGFADHLKVPDANPIARHMPVPMRTLMFSEIDNKIGWYAGASWDEAALGKVQFLYYNNEANPEKIRTQVAWETEFWSAGIQTQIDDFTFLAQGMTGSTYIQPSPYFESDTYFDAAYFLVGWSLSEEWRLAGRFDWFQTNEERTGGIRLLNEHGHALTFAANYLPNDWLRLTAEYLRIDSTRSQRNVVALSPRQIETQLQFSVRAYLP